MRHHLRTLLLSFSLILTLLLAACGSTGTTSSTTPTPTPVPPTPTPTVAPVTLNVFAAASLTESFTEIGTKYQQLHPNVTLKFNFAGSQTLVQQLTNGAPADVFASADLANMQTASTNGLVGDSKVFVKNKLVVIVPVANPANISSLKDLTKSGLKLDIAAATVPVGKYTRQVLDKLSKSPDYGSDYSKSVLANVVSQEDNVKAVVSKVQLGEADAGFVYATDVTIAVSDKVKIIEIPDSYNVIAQYPIAVVKNSANATEAQKFVDYILSADGQAVMTKYHFTGVNA